jgi:hypothetical protein
MTPKYSVGDRIFDTHAEDISLILQIHPEDHSQYYCIRCVDGGEGWFSKGFIESEVFILAPDRENIHEIIGYDS